MSKLFATVIHLNLAALCLVGFYTQARASTLLFSSVTENASGLYTYNYSVDNTAGAGNIFEVSILVSPQPLTPSPVSFTAPTGWSLTTPSSGSIASPPYNECCGFYQFFEGGGGSKGDPLAIPVGAVVGGFSFSVYAAPSQFSLNNYFLYGVPEGIAAYGFTLAPEISGMPFPAATPLPAALPLYATGLGALALLRWRRKRKAASRSMVSA
jgi:hypothetical protein